MELSKQVTSVPISKRLKELGVKQESLFWWQELPIYDGNSEIIGRQWAISRTTRAFEPFYSAFTVAELGEMLPFGTASYFNGKTLDWRCVPAMSMQELPKQTAATEANVRGIMLIYLLENKLV